MKLITAFAFLFLSALLVSTTLSSATSAQDSRKPPEVRMLGAEAKLGIVKFSHLDHITKSFGSKTVLKDASFQLNPNEKVGLVGRNGT